MKRKIKWIQYTSPAPYARHRTKNYFKISATLMLVSPREMIDLMFCPWGQINGVIIKLILKVRLRVDLHYYNTTYNTTYSDFSCDKFSNAISLTNDIVLFIRRLKYSFILESSIRIYILHCQSLNILCCKMHIDSYIQCI